MWSEFFEALIIPLIWTSIGDLQGLIKSICLNLYLPLGTTTLRGVVDRHASIQAVCKEQSKQ